MTLLCSARYLQKGARRLAASRPSDEQGREGQSLKAYSRPYLSSLSNGDIGPVSVPSNLLQTLALRANNLVSHPLTDQVVRWPRLA
ncbi:hypothetical protein RHGRI_024479 [Rhododendron griersonianum]|uniref:Uncharacterized protein n=1 Tax=Rhododendron griersonianum TaxID=479676 RepID=A0AAV6JBW3_9ERIC|nr:hypothetical protein RHGRI_024479 [Rhododendron griersonianum]